MTMRKRIAWGVCGFALAVAGAAGAATVTFHDFAAVTGLAPTDEFPLWDITNSASKKITTTNLRAALVNDAELTSLAGLTSAANKLPYYTGSGTAALADLSAFGRTIIDDADAAAVRTTVDAQQLDAELSALAGLTSAADKLPYFTGAGTAGVADFTTFGRSLVDDANAAAGLATLGAQASDAELSALAGLTSGADAAPYFTGSGTASVMTVTAAARTVLDDTTVGNMLTTLGGQPVDADLTALGGVTSGADALPYFTGAGTASVTTLTAAARTVLDDTTVGAMVTTLGAQPLDADLTALGGLTSASDALPYFTGSGTAAVTTLTSAARTVLDDTTVGAMVTTLGAQPLDSDLTSFAANSTDGGLYHTAAGTITARTPTCGAGLTCTNMDGVSAAPAISFAAKRIVARDCTFVPPQTLGATYGVLTGASTPAESFQTWDFDAATNWYVDLQCKLDATLPASTGVDLKLCFVAASATSGDTLWDGSFRRMDSAVDLDTTAFTYTTAAQEITITTSATAGKPTCSTIGFTSGTNMNSSVAGDMVNVRLWRNAAAGGDNMTGNARLLAQSVVIQEQ